MREGGVAEQRASSLHAEAASLRADLALKTQDAQRHEAARRRLQRALDELTRAREQEREEAAEEGSGLRRAAEDARAEAARRERAAAEAVEKRLGAELAAARAELARVGGRARELAAQNEALTKVVWGDAPADLATPPCSPPRTPPHLTSPRHIPPNRARSPFGRPRGRWRACQRQTWWIGAW